MPSFIDAGIGTSKPWSHEPSAAQRSERSTLAVVVNAPASASLAVASNESATVMAAVGLSSSCDQPVMSLQLAVSSDPMGSSFVVSAA